MKHRLLSIEKLFWFWYLTGLVLLTTIGVPKPLQFANGVFNILYAAYVMKLEWNHSSSYHMHRRVVTAIIFAGLFTWGIEAWGIATGWPFGEYTYTSVLGFSVLGVPVSIVAAWIAVIGNGILIADRLLLAGFKRSRWAYGKRSYHALYLLYRAIALAILAVTLDLVLDPVAHAIPLWEWKTTDHDLVGIVAPAGFMGIPWSNFIAWGCIAAFLSLLYPVPPASSESVRITDHPFRLFQAVLLMFGIIGLSEQLVPCFVIAVIAGLAVEGGIRFARSQEKRLV